MPVLQRRVRTSVHTNCKTATMPGINARHVPHFRGPTELKNAGSMATHPLLIAAAAAVQPRPRSRTQAPCCSAAPSRGPFQ